MNCRRARLLLTGVDPPSRSVRDHLAGCEECADFSRRLGAVQTALSEHRAKVSVPAGFASRIRARLEPADDPLGWAALRLLPASLGLVLLLGWLNLRALEPSAYEAADPTSAVLSWVLDPSDESVGSDQTAGEDTR